MQQTGVSGANPAPFGPFGILILFVSILMLGILLPLAALGAAPGYLLLAVIGGGLYLWRERRLPPLPWSVLLPLFAFILYGRVSVAWTLAPKDASALTITFLYEFLPGFLLFPALAALLPPETAQRIARWLIPAALVGIALLAVEILLDQPIQRLFSEPKLPVDLVRPVNRSALLVAFAAGPMALILWRLGKGWQALAWLVGVLVLVAVSTSQSAAAALLALIPLILLAWYFPRVTAILTGVAIVAGLAFCADIAQWMFNAGLAHAPWMPDSFQHRIMIWNFAAEHLPQRPWQGFGLDSSRAIPGGNDGFIGTEGWRKLPLHPHNFFMQVRLELGWIGAVLTGWLMLSILPLLARLRAADTRAVALALYATCIFAQCFAYGAWQTWLLCGILFCFFLIMLADRMPPRPIKG
jgi:O-antigen ligase